MWTGVSCGGLCGTRSDDLVVAGQDDGIERRGRNRRVWQVMVLRIRIGRGVCVGVVAGEKGGVGAGNEVKV